MRPGVCICSWQQLPGCRVFLLYASPLNSHTHTHTHTHYSAKSLRPQLKEEFNEIDAREFAKTVAAKKKGMQKMQSVGDMSGLEEL